MAVSCGHQDVVATRKDLDRDDLIDKVSSILCSSVNLASAEENGFLEVKEPNVAV